MIDLLNSISDAYFNEVVKKERQQETEKLKRLEQTKTRLEDSYDETLRKLGELAATFGSSQSENVKLQLDMKVKKLASLEMERMSARKKLNEARDLYLQQRMRLQSNMTFQPRDFEIEDMLLQYPEYQAMKSQLVEIEQAMKMRSSQIRGGMSGGAGMQAQVSALKSQMEQFKYEKKNEALQRLRMLTNRDDRDLQQELEMLDLQVRTAEQRLSELNKEYDELSQELEAWGRSVLS